MLLHPDPVAEQRPAGERGGRVDGQHGDPQVTLPVGRDQRPGEGGLTHAGGTGQAEHPGPASPRGQFTQHRAEFRRTVLDQ